MARWMTAAAALLTAAHAHGQVSLSFDGRGRGGNVTISTDGGTAFQRVFAGQLRFEVTDGELGERNFYTYCVDPQSSVARDAAYDPLNLASTLRLEGRDHAATRAGVIEDFARAAGPTLFEGAPAGNDAAAFQLAVWEILMDYDPGVGLASLSLDGGQFRARSVSAGVRSAFDALFNGGLPGEDDLAWTPTLVSFYETTGQSQHQFTASSRMPAIPAPAATAMVASGLVLLAHLRARRAAGR